MAELLTALEPIVAEENPETLDDAESSFGDGTSAASTSVTDNIRNYREIHGRTFHNFGQTEYWGPNDENANEQWDIGHHLNTLILDNKLHLAPIRKDVQKVLDIGTGTGIWAIDFADEYPSAQVLGTDLSPIQPSWIPPNLKFEIDDAQQEWTYPPNTLDLIHMRTMIGSIDDWPLLYKRAFDAIKPGGYFEGSETDIVIRSNKTGLFEAGSPLERWGPLFVGAGEKMGRTFLVAERARKLLEEAGFVDIVEKPFKAPIGSWPADKKLKEIGRWYLLFLTTGLEAMGLYMLKVVLGWEYEEVQAYLWSVKAELLKGNNQAYCNITTFYARKPDSAAE